MAFIEVYEFSVSGLRRALVHSLDLKNVVRCGIK